MSLSCRTSACGQPCSMPIYGAVLSACCVPVRATSPSIYCVAGFHTLWPHTPQCGPRDWRIPGRGEASQPQTAAAVLCWTMSISPRQIQLMCLPVSDLITPPPSARRLRVQMGPAWHLHGARAAEWRPVPRLERSQAGGCAPLEPKRQVSGAGHSPGAWLFPPQRHTSLGHQVRALSGRASSAT